MFIDEIRLPLYLGSLNGREPSPGPDRDATFLAFELSTLLLRWGRLGIKSGGPGGSDPCSSPLSQACVVGVGVGVGVDDASSSTGLVFKLQGGNSAGEQHLDTRPVGLCGFEGESQAAVLPDSRHHGLVHTAAWGVGEFDGDGAHGGSAYITREVGVALVKITFPFSTEMLMGCGLFFLIRENAEFDLLLL